MKRRFFGELELLILDVVQKHGPISVKEVQKILGDKDQYTTLMTVMVRLIDKGAFIRKKKGRSYLYSLAKGTNRSNRNVLESIKDKLFGGRSMGMISYLLESSDDITGEEIKELENLIHEARKRK